MDFADLLLGLYGLIAVAAMLMTRAEQTAKGMDRPGPILAGYAASALWPVLFAVVLVIVMIRRPASA